MPTYKCNSCGGTYTTPQADGMAYYHVCPTETIEPAGFDVGGKLTTQEKRTRRTDIRDERPAPGTFYADGKPFVQVPNPEERNQFILAPGGGGIVSEGKGRTLIE